MFIVNSQGMWLSYTKVLFTLIEISSMYNYNNHWHIIAFIMMWHLDWNIIQLLCGQTVEPLRQTLVHDHPTIIKVYNYIAMHKPRHTDQNGVSLPPTSCNKLMWSTYIGQVLSAH